MKEFGKNNRRNMGRKKNNCKLFPYKRTELLSAQDVQQKAGWEITAFDLPSTWKHTQGEGVVVAVIDTGVDLSHQDLVKNLLPGKNFIDPKKDPIDDSGHGCISKETLVHTNFSGITEIEYLYNSLDCQEETMLNEDGVFFIKNVEQINLKTLSLDSKNINPVVSQIEAVHKIPINREIINVELEGNINFKLTPWHPVYLLLNKHHKVYEIQRKRADEIKIGDHFVFPSNSNFDFGETQFVEINEGFICENCKHIPKYCLKEKPSFCKKCKSKNWSTNNRKIIINKDIAWLCGIVLTDGYIFEKANRIKVSSNTPEILNKVKNITERLGFSSKIQKNRILVYGKSIVKILLNLGVFSKNKSLNQTLPLWVGKSPLPIMCSFIAGVVDGDGCISKTNKKNRITTASIKFANEMACLMNFLGMPASVSNPEFDNRKRKIISKNPVYKINHSSLNEMTAICLAHPKKIERSKIKIKYQRKCRRVKSINKEEYCGFFYDFTVKNYHNYIANGHFVSNTHVSGIICAENNDIGVVGVAPKTKIIPIKVLDKNGNGNLENVSKAIIWAADQKVDFITMSLGSPEKIDIVHNAIKYAASKKIVVFCAAGNAGNQRKVFYPAAYKEVIGIGAVDENFNLAGFSCTGPDLDFVAPGVEILSTVPTNWYAMLSGTSMANPFVTGIACLLLSYKRKNNLDIKLETASDYINVLKQYTIPVSNSEFAGKRFFEGFGIIDPRKMEKWVKENSKVE